MGAVAIGTGHLSVAYATIRRRQQVTHSWREWLSTCFRSYTTSSFAERHIRFWEWLSSLEPGVKPRPRVEVWPRGGAKSTTIELGCTFLGSQPSPQRHYVLYVSETQGQADKHVQSIAGMLERVGVRRAMNEYGSSKGWRRTEIRTANGFNVTAFGLDSGMRGVKLDEFRPDIIVMDDIDGRHDTPATTQKKIDVITETVLPAGSADCAVIVIQNRITDDSIVSRLADGQADFLYDRVVTEEPAIRDLVVERTIDANGVPRFVITGGTPTWEGQSLATCEAQINEWGEGAFRREAQHEVEDVEGGLWNKERDIVPFRVNDWELPALDSIGVGIDPNATGRGDEAGIIVAGISRQYKNYLHDRNHGYVLADYSVSGGPKAWAEAAVAAYHDYNADFIVAEANNGGEMVRITLETVDGAPSVRLVNASRGKRTRAEPVQKKYEDGLVHHVGTFPQLEKQQCSWDPSSGMQSPDRLDANVWILTELLLGGTSVATDQSVFAPIPESGRSRRQRLRRMER